MAVATEKEERIVVEVQLSPKISLGCIREALKIGVRRIEIVTPSRKLDSVIRRRLKANLMMKQMAKIKFKKLKDYLS